MEITTALVMFLAYHKGFRVIPNTITRITRMVTSLSQGI